MSFPCKVCGFEWAEWDDVKKCPHGPRLTPEERAARMAELRASIIAADKIRPCGTIYVRLSRDEVCVRTGLGSKFAKVLGQIKVEKAGGLVPALEQARALVVAHERAKPRTTTDPEWREEDVATRVVEESEAVCAARDKAESKTKRVEERTAQGGFTHGRVIRRAGGL